MQKPNLTYMKETLLKNEINQETIQSKHFNNDFIFDSKQSHHEIKNCLFEGVTFEECQEEDSYFLDVVFQNCDLSNMKFYSCLFRRVQFMNCKLMGTDFSESVFDQVNMKDCLCKFANFAFMKNKETVYQLCDFTQASIIETNLKKSSFIECSFNQCELQHASLSQIDLSTCDLNNIITTPEDIRGAIIDSYQAASLIHLLRVQIKE
ncbi:pentapeptide repeat-containing protein [Candidatus Stoquefichus massiliensis]|uniref:pentapeptide repeat-containing protein n=1 Tax=Candidatus Stoquefichus massiliensis TaxID=1470350 RepID=UPI0004856701|nr:pentapeptide repeat-containing protein [Candidatus Stoquefichus massiliensis]